MFKLAGVQVTADPAVLLTTAKGGKVHVRRGDCWPEEVGAAAELVHAGFEWRSLNQMPSWKCLLGILCCLVQQHNEVMTEEPIDCQTLPSSGRGSMNACTLGGGVHVLPALDLEAVLFFVSDLFKRA